MSDKSFVCKAPWTSVAFQPEGIGPCCIYELDDLEAFSDGKDHFKSIREDFLKGQIPKGCHTCESAFLENRKGYYSAFDRYDTDFKTINIQEVNIKSNNFCNLACRSCGPHFSSKWEEEFSKTIVITKDTELFNKLEFVDFSKLRHIRFAGGEPTLTGDHVRVLQNLIQLGNTNVDIAISTNLHSLKYKDVDLLELWKQFPKLTLQLSIDGVEERASVIRSGTDWDLVCKNLKIIQHNQIGYYIGTTVSALNIWFLEETIDYLQNQLGVQNIKYSILTGPDILSMQVIPEEYRSDVNAMLDRCIAQGHKLEHIQHYFNLQVTDELWNHFLIYNLMLDATRKETFIDNLPIKHQLIDRWLKV